MLLMRLLIALIAIHVGLGFTALVYSYFAGDVADYGAAGIFSHTEIGRFVNLETDPEDRQSNWANPRAMYGIVNNFGDAINGLLTFNYTFLNEIQPDDGLAYNGVIILRVIGTLFSLGLGLAFLRILFQSNILTSKLGFGLVAFGAASTVVSSVVGATTGG